MANKSQFSFFKMVASGNDFIVIDNRKNIVQDPAALAREACARHTGVGADGVLLFENSRKADFKMRIINADGSEAEACGNGFRCIALFAKEKLGYPSDCTFETQAGMIQSTIRGRAIRVRLPNPKDFREDEEIEVTQHRLHYYFINTGVPHVVIFVEGLLKINVPELGRAIRWHSRFQPKGTNVNFAEIKAKNEIHVRTYERGVENETQACGTGVTASALTSSLAGYTVSPVRVKTRGGEILTVDFKQNGKKITDVFLQGGTRFVFEGKLLLDSKT
ncbi:MAG: diaminopimelate epimerase [Candidatus Omnitrophica bacterium]|nr:diaminopimelate epimerase [Candidatus Omnitrophota bacterium]